MREPISEVVVLGGGTAGLLTALTLKSMLPQLDVTVVHCSELPPIGVGESTTSLLPPFLHDGLRLDPATFFSEVRPTWKLGIRFQWEPSETRHFYYPFDRPLDGRFDALGKENAYYYFADGRVFSPYTEMMDSGKSPCVPGPGGEVTLDHRYGYHIENRALIEYLKSQARGREIRIVDRQVGDVEVDSSGTVSAVVSADGGERMTADLYVDCTGFASRLLGGALREPFVDYGQSLFCDSAVTGGWDRRRGILPYTNCRAMNHGWCWNIELADRVSCGYVFSSRFCDEREAVEEMRARYPALEETTRLVKFRTGRYERFWVNNVAAIGNAAGFVEPLESTGLHMIAVTARTLGQALVDTDRRVNESMRREINRFVGRLWDDIRDFLVLHFVLNADMETPFWRHCRRETELAGAGPILEFYRSCGPSSIGAELIAPNSIFRYAGYLTLLIGLNAESEYRFEPDGQERRRWDRIREEARHVASLALPMDEGLKLQSRTT